MKKYIFTFRWGYNPLFYTVVFLFFRLGNAYSQNYVTVSDTFLLEAIFNKVPNALNGNQLQTDHPDVLALEDLFMLSYPPGNTLTDLSPISYFTGLKTLHLEGYFINQPPPFPPRLRHIELLGSQLSSLNPFPDSLEHIYFANNTFGSIPPLPSTMKFVRLPANGLNVFPDVDHLDSLKVLALQDNLLTGVLPQLPDSLVGLYINGNQITGFSNIPPILSTLIADDNALNSFPPFPPNVLKSSSDVSLKNNFISCIPSGIPSDLYIYLDGNPISCVPDLGSYTTYLLNLPLCNENDPVNNPNMCPLSGGVYGKLYFDVNADCLPDSSEFLTSSNSVILKNAMGDVIAMSSMGDFGNYFLPAPPGQYTVEIVVPQPFMSQTACGSATVQPVSLTSGNPVMEDVNFPLVCPSDPDYFIHSYRPLGLVFPGQSHTFFVSFAELTALSGGNCFSLADLNVNLSFTGPAVILSTNLYNAGGTTSIIGNQIAVSVDSSDYLTSYLSVLLTVDTSAQAGDNICVDISLTDPQNQELDLSNNTAFTCYEVFNSYDPNMKMVVPDTVQPGFDDYFTYTVFFQNTGNAPAINIRIEDLLDNNLDLNSLYITSASHPYTLNLIDRRMMMFFHDIFLVDSITDPIGSIGYFQYKVKPETNLPAGTIISNTADIYFDFNSPIYTNTTQNLFYENLNIGNYSEFISVFVFPNPSDDFITISGKFDQGEIVDLMGKKLLSFISGHKDFKSVDISGFRSGMYILRLFSEDGLQTVRFIKK